MSQTTEATAFIQRIASLPSGPGISLDDALQPSLDDEAELRRLFATDKTNARLANPHVGLVDVFDAPVGIRTTRARIVKDEADLSANYVMPLSDVRRRKEGAPAMVTDLDEFKRNWGVFTENSLSQLFNWSNVIASGGAVLACLSALPEYANVSKRTIRKYFHSTAYPTSDVDLFLWGVTPEQAEVKINAIYEAVRDSVPWDVTCVRTKHAVSIHSQYPYRSVQIVLRLYNSPAEILAGFDIDAPCCAYDGNRVWANPRAVVAMMRQANTVDMTRRSPSYEIRLAKYSARGFEVYVPALRRDDVDPTIYERSILRIEGLARLLVLEKLDGASTRLNFLESRRTLRGRPDPPTPYRRRNRKYKRDLKADTTVGGLEMNDYDTLHIPYGPGWDSKRVDRLVYQNDLGMNSTFNPRNKHRQIHRHPAFFGTMQECIEDCCGCCPEPINDEEKKLQEEEDRRYIRGRITFIQENPGRQSISGSFNPINEGEWSSQAYIGPTEKLFAAIVAQDRLEVAKMIVCGVDVNRRDHVGRTPLHVAIIIKAADIACDLIDAGARMTWRLVDGRTSLHLAAQLDLHAVVRTLLARSKVNKERAEKAEAGEETKELVTAEEERQGDHNQEEEERIRNSSEDDWDSEESDHPIIVKKAVVKTDPVAKPDEGAVIPEDEDDTPDVLDVNAPDWDHAFTPLSYAVLYASLAVIDELLVAGADVKLITQAHGYKTPAFYPLSLTTLTEDEDHATKVAERLLLAGASSSAADPHMCTIFHRVVCSKRTKLASALLRSDPNASAVINFPFVSFHSVAFPIIPALASRSHSMVSLLLAHGAKIVFSEEDVLKAKALSAAKQRHSFNADDKYPMSDVHSPAETAIAYHDDVISLLAALGANLNLGIQKGTTRWCSEDCYLSLLDWVCAAGHGLSIRILKVEQFAQPSQSSSITDINASDWKGHFVALVQGIKGARYRVGSYLFRTSEDRADAVREINEIKDYLSEVEQLLVAHNAQTWDEMHPRKKSDSSAGKHLRSGKSWYDDDVVAEPTYLYLGDSNYYRLFVPKHLIAKYDQLYEACYSGDNAKIQKLCFPPEGSSTEPIQISVQLLIRPEDRSGYSPLYVAVSRRHWDTARLVLAIAVGQYRPHDKEREFSTKDIVLDDDAKSDSGSDDSCESDETIDRPAVNFTDVTKQPSQVYCKARPRMMLCEVQCQFITKYGSVSDSNLLQMAVIDGDLEAFVHIADLHKTLSVPLSDEPRFLDVIMMNDRAEILDEFIRRTGSGVQNILASEDDNAVPFVHDRRGLYLGLSVHGKKRKDLTNNHDPNAAWQDDVVVPLLWKAIRRGAVAIMKYLAGDRPLAAYRFYCSTNNDECAERLRRTVNLEKVLPEWLGWRISVLNESPLTAAVLGNELDILKMLFEMSPKLMGSALHERVKFLGYNALMLAIDRGCKTDIVDFLLAKGISPTESDSDRNWNIFHLLCFRGHNDLMEHLLRKLPPRDAEFLLGQRSKGRLNTPLHIAVKLGEIRAVRSLLEFKKCNLLLKNVNGCTPLHIAAQEGFAEITGLLVAASPSDALRCENGVGEVPLEIASQQELLWRTRHKYNENIEPAVLPNNKAETTPPRFQDHAEAEIANLKVMLDELAHDGRLPKGSTLAKELFAFADSMQIKLLEFKLLPKRSARIDSNRKDEVDRTRTLQLIRSALSASTGIRQLLRLIDVQKSVQSDLAKTNLNKNQIIAERYTSTRKRNHEGLEPEEDVEAQQRRRSLVLSAVTTSPDPL